MFSLFPFRLFTYYTLVTTQPILGGTWAGILSESIPQLTSKRNREHWLHFFFFFLQITGLFEMIVRVLTACHTQYT